MAVEWPFDLKIAHTDQHNGQHNAHAGGHTAPLRRHHIKPMALERNPSKPRGGQRAHSQRRLGGLTSLGVAELVPAVCRSVVRGPGGRGKAEDEEGGSQIGSRARECGGGERAGASDTARSPERSDGGAFFSLGSPGWKGIGGRPGGPACGVGVAAGAQEGEHQGVAGGARGGEHQGLLCRWAWRSSGGW